MDALPIAGRFFEDIIDGYFPLRESLRQMLARQGFGAALVVITHAPILHLAGDDGAGPVPMRLQQAEAGLLRGFLGLAALHGNGMQLTGLADWQWPGAERGLSGDTRLAEPAFLRGIGLLPGPLDGGMFGKVARDEGSGLFLNRAGLPGWGFTRILDGIERDGSAIISPSRKRSGDGPVIAIAPAHQRQSDAMLRDLSAGWRGSV